MISAERALELMKSSIELAKKSVSEKGKLSPKVGAVLADKDGKVILDCYRGETGKGNHCEYGLLKKASEKNINIKDTVLFVTLEPCTSRGRGKTPCAKRIVDSGIGEVYIGTLDPNPVITGKGELFLRDHITVNRYPHSLIEELKELNKEFFDNYKDAYLPNDSLFMTKKIPTIMEEYLRGKNYNINDNLNLPLDWDVEFDFISAYCKDILGDTKTRNALLNEALGYAYDQKYAQHTYKDDVRGAYSQWRTAFREILKELSTSLKNSSTLVVGCGNGQEGKFLYPNVDNLILVDIAPKSLEEAKNVLSPQKTFVLNAQNLVEIMDSSVDAYISLMTYQSTYFDIDKALTEAFRVLANEGIIVISIANGFMKDEKIYINGIIDPANGLINKNRPYELVEKIRKKLLSFGFVSLGIRTTPSEIFIYARKV